MVAGAGASAAPRIQTSHPTSAAAAAAAAAGGPLPTSEAVSAAAGARPLLLPPSGCTPGSGDTPPTTGAVGRVATGAPGEAEDLTRQ